MDSSILNNDEIAYATHLIDQHFGPHCARVVSLMLRCGGSYRLPLRDIVNLANDPKWESTGPTLSVTPMSVLNVRTALVVLMHHQCILATTRDAANGRVTYLYRVVAENVLARGLFSHYLEVAVSEFGDIGAHILGEVLQHGSLCPDAISVPEHLSTSELDNMVAELRKKKWLRVMELDPTQRKTMNLAEDGRVSALGANFRALDAAVTRIILGKFVEHQLGASRSFAFTALFQAAVCAKDEQLTATKQAVSEVMPFVPAPLQEQEVTTYLRDMQTDSCMGSMVTTATKEIVERQTIYVDAGGDSVKKRKSRKVQTIEAKKNVDAFSIDMKAVRRKILRDFSRSVVRQRFGVGAARVYAILDDNSEQMFEVDQLSEHCLLPRKDVCIILNELTQHSFVLSQEIPKGQHSSQCAPANVPIFGTGVWAYSVNRAKCGDYIRCLLSKSLHNLLVRFRDEVEGRATIPPELDIKALQSTQDVLERSFLQLQLSYLAVRDI